jgi:hypothetical protein
LRANPLFLTGISKLRKLIIKEWIKHVLTTTFLLSLILNSIALGVQEIRLFFWEGYSIYPLLILVSFVFSLLYALRRKKSFMDELIEIDVRLNLQERLSTAYECHQRGRKSVFVDLLMKEAGNLLGSIKTSQLFPRNFSPAHLLIPIFAGVIIILLLVDFAPTAPIRDKATEERLKQIGSQMEQYSKRELQDIQRAKFRKDVHRQMENIAKELKSGSMTKKGLLKSLGQLIREAEVERAQLARRLEAELSLGDITHTPMLRPLLREKVTPNELKQLRKKLEALFEGHVPASLSRDISSLDQNLRLEEFLDKTMNEIRVALSKEVESYLLEREKVVFGGKASEQGNDNNEETSRGRALIGLQSGAADAKRQISSATAGRGKAKGEERSPYELESSKGPAIKDKGGSGQGDWYNVYVRSLPTIGNAKVKEEDVIRPYRQELESVLQKEDIPLNYREYIKSYFLSIGLKKEENRDGYGN